MLGWRRPVTASPARRRLVATRARWATLLATGQKLTIRHEHNGRGVISNLPPEPPHPAVNVIKIRFASQPKPLPEPAPAAWLTGGAR